jgi:ArsR family transcriptional regulator, arsenate/arsenite/antimonite-responsive transcriptional repressor
MDTLLNIFKALSDKNRLRILLMLTKRTMCVCEIQEILGAAASTVSTHLSILKETGFITDERRGKWVFFSLNTASKDIVLTQVLLVLPFYLNDDDVVKSDFEKVNSINKIIKCSI